MKWDCLHFNQLTTDQLHDIVSLRISIFIVEQNCPYPELDGKDKHCLHVFATDEQGIVQACSRIVPPGLSYEEPAIGRVCTSSAVRGTGAGRELMKKTLDYLQEKYGSGAIRISAQEYLIRFYGEFGFKLTGKKYLEDDIPHVEMIRDNSR